MHSLHLYPNKLAAIMSGKDKKDFDKVTESDKIRDVTDKVYIKYKNRNEVQERRGECLKFKILFLMQLYHLKNRGQQLTSIAKVFEWIDDNLDTLFSNYKKSQLNIVIAPKRAKSNPNENSIKKSLK